jgi:hypothetical protein
VIVKGFKADRPVAHYRRHVYSYLWKTRLDRFRPPPFLRIIQALYRVKPRHSFVCQSEGKKLRNLAQRNCIPTALALDIKRVHLACITGNHLPSYKDRTRVSLENRKKRAFFFFSIFSSPASTSTHLFRWNAEFITYYIKQVFDHIYPPLHFLPSFSSSSHLSIPS